MTSKLLNVINIYKSHEGTAIAAVELLRTVNNPEKETIILGDFNLCYATEVNVITTYSYRR